MGRTPRNLIIISVVAAVGWFSASITHADLMGDQRQRDLTRVLSEVVQRAHSRALTGEVIRPETATPAITLSADGLHDGWMPDCGMTVSVSAADPTRNLLSLVLVPRDRLAASGEGFVAYAVFAGAPVLTTEMLTPPYPEWMIQENGGFASLEGDLGLLLGHSAVDLGVTQCDGFAFYTITGTPR
jgi:hypothetical protein